MTDLIKNFIKGKGLGFYFAAVSIVFAVIALIAYSVAGQDSYGFVPAVVVLLAFGIVSCGVFAYRNFFRIGPMVAMAFFGGAAGVFVYSRFMYYSHQFYGIASDPITGAMVLATIAFIGMLLTGILSGFFKWDKGGDTL